MSEHSLFQRVAEASQVPRIAERADCARSIGVLESQTKGIFQHGIENFLPSNCDNFLQQGTPGSSIALRLKPRPDFDMDFSMSGLLVTGEDGTGTKLGPRVIRILETDGEGNPYGGSIVIHMDHSPITGDTNLSIALPSYNSISRESAPKLYTKDTARDNVINHLQETMEGVQRYVSWENPDDLKEGMELVIFDPLGFYSFASHELSPSLPFN